MRAASSVGCRCDCHAQRRGVNRAAACRQGTGEIGRPPVQFHTEPVLRPVRCRYEQALATQSAGEPGGFAGLEAGNRIERDNRDVVASGCHFLNGLALGQSSSTTCSRHITTICRSLPGVIRAALESIPGSPPWPVRAFRARRRLLGSCRSRSRGASGRHLAILSASTPGSTPESFSRTIAGACILERAREWQRILP